MNMHVDLLASTKTDDKVILAVLMGQHLNGDNPKIKRGVSHEVTYEGIKRDVIG